MQQAETLLDAGWDFIGETANGTEEIWWINEGKDYPRLWWKLPGLQKTDPGRVCTGSCKVGRLKGAWKPPAALLSPQSGEMAMEEHSLPYPAQMC